MTIRRGVAMMAAVAAVLSFSGMSHAAGSACPRETTCGLYALQPFRWPTQRGIATIHFSINPTLQPWVAASDAEAAILAATRAWQAASPALRFVYDGRTTRIPSPHDGFNDIGWQQLDPGVLSSTTITSNAGRVVEADIAFNVLKPWQVAPCAQHNGSCTPVPSDLGMLSRFQVQAVATHELGHWLGLADLHDARATELTMYESFQPGSRKQETLGLGDVRGVRALYPTRGKRMPAVWSP